MDYSIWQTASQGTLRITDMKTDHIKNCIKMIEEQNPEKFFPRYSDIPYHQYKPYIEVFNKELELRAKRGFDITCTSCDSHRVTHMPLIRNFTAYGHVMIGYVIKCENCKKEKEFLR